MILMTRLLLIKLIDSIIRKFLHYVSLLFSNSFEHEIERNFLLPPLGNPLLPNWQPIEPSIRRYTNIRDPEHQSNNKYELVRLPLVVVDCKPRKSNVLRPRVHIVVEGEGGPHVEPIVGHN